MGLVFARTKSFSRWTLMWRPSLCCVGVLYAGHKYMKHELKWNAATQRWLCLGCLRTSDQVTKSDAESEMNQFECIPPIPITRGSDSRD
jgi:hypothetical protein